jgi:hypothetical protein
MLENLASLLSHPLFLLLAGAGLTQIILPRITYKWLNRAEELKLKASLVRTVTEATESYFGSIQLVEYIGTSAPKTLEEAFVEWRIQHGAIEADIQAYLTQDTELFRLWSALGAGLWTLFFLLRNQTPEARRAILLQNTHLLRRGEEDCKTLIERPLTGVGESHAQYDFKLSMLLDTFRFQRLEIVKRILAAPSVY